MAILSGVSQFASSTGNFVVFLAVARTSTVDETGEFSLAFTIYLLTLIVSRSYVGEHLILRHRSDAPATPSDSVGASVVIGISVGIIVTAFLGQSSGPSEFAAIVLASLPWLLAHDALRYLSFASGRPFIAAVGDVVWLTVSAIPLLLGIVWGVGLGPTAVGFWSAGGLLAALIMARLHGVRVSLGRGSLWLEHDVRFRGGLAVEALATNGALNLSIYLLALSAGTAAVASVRMSQSVFQPIALAYGTLFVVLARRSVAAATSRPRDVAVLVAQVAGVLVTGSLVLAAAALAIPQSAGETVAGATFSAARPYFGIFGAFVAVSGVGTSAVFGLKVLGAVRSAAIARLLWGILLVALTWVGAATWGVDGYIGGATLASGCAAAVWLVALFRAIGRRERDRVHNDARTESDSGYGLVTLKDAT